MLIHWQTVEGNLQFAAPDALAAEPREGDTLVHIPRVSPHVRVREKERPGRQPARTPRFQAVRVRSIQALTVGRDPACDVRLDDYTVSAHHARLWGVPGTLRLWVEDVGSRNGTGHNGVRLVEGLRSELHSGDELVLGRFVLLFLHPLDFHRYLRGELG